MDLEQLKEKLDQISDKLTKIERPQSNRFFLLCESPLAFAVNRFLFEQLGARFIIATGIDSDDCFEVIYHFAYDQLGAVINVKAFIRDRNKPEIDSISPFIPAAEWIEREIHDILGINFRNHPNLKRLILADDWPAGVYPMRKQMKTQPKK